ncbi:unnamed protein product [Cylicocyclus nassatus]|uniref:Uncharacterized protein n=1 Tax=Cylicocyclus nassatus TaxID=53992 RepID=A0AA36MC46_CYLNA|nr:unnamed protein product [Cylicocyclus nassatus]
MKLLFVLFALFAIAQADWWDSFTDTIAGGFMSAAKWVKETASPAIREKFDSAKASLQDPETHKTIREWISDKAEKASQFANEESGQSRLMTSTLSCSIAAHFLCYNYFCTKSL